MKKIFKTLVAASVLICGLVFTSCGYLLEKEKEGNEDLTLKDYILNKTLQDSENKWYKYQGELPSIPIGAIADVNESAQAGSLENAELYLYFNRDTGLTVAIQASTEQNVELFGGALATTMELVTGNVNTYSDFTTVKWVGLKTYSATALIESEEPLVSAHPEQCLLIGGDKANTITIQWKKVLANIIINKLCGE